jgi:hypothetical protein
MSSGDPVLIVASQGLSRVHFLPPHEQLALTKAQQLHISPEHAYLGRTPRQRYSQIRE